MADKQPIFISNVKSEKTVPVLSAPSAPSASASSSVMSKPSTSNLKDSAADLKAKSGGSSLADFLLHLEDYTPTVRFFKSEVTQSLSPYNTL